MSNGQLEFELPAPSLGDETPLAPARMVNEFVYCPRLAYLMWTQGEWAETGDTVEGHRIHARVDRPNAPLPSPQAIESAETANTRIVSRSLTLSSQRMGIIAKLDIAEAEDGIVTPIDYKRGKRPHVSQGVYEPERIQVCLQAMLLEEHGYKVGDGAIYYAESRERVRVVLDEALRAAARKAVSDLRLTVSQGRIPPPLADSPKCPRCALVTICLPDELRSLSGSSLAPRMFKTVHGYGEWIQLSIFQCRLSRRRRADLETRLRELVKSGEDHVLLIDVGPADKVELAIESIGKSYSKVERSAMVI